MVFGRPLSTVTANDVQRLIDDRRQEDKVLDYKRDLPGDDREAKREFLKDVISFANSAGGTLLYGIDEARDAQGNPTGIPSAVIGIGDSNTDQQKARLENILRDGVAPRIPGVDVRPIGFADDRQVLAVRVPRSWAGPHMRRSQGDSRFYGRNSVGKYSLDVAEIRSAFLYSEGRQRAFDRFREGRLGRILTGDTPVPMSDARGGVLLVYPVGINDSEFVVDPRHLARERLLPAVLGNSGFTSYQYNFDGVATYLAPAASQPAVAYLQVFRSAVVEAMDSLVISEGQERVGLGLLQFEDDTVTCIASVLDLYQVLELDPPFLVMVALVGVRGCEIIVSPYDSPARHDARPIDRDVLVGPTVIIDEFDVQLADAIRPTFDAFWQASGYAGVPASRR